LKFGVSLDIRILIFVIRELPRAPLSGRG
jgi:hypothetical protein